MRFLGLGIMEKLMASILVKGLDFDVQVWKRIQQNCEFN